MLLIDEHPQSLKNVLVTLRRALTCDALFRKANRPTDRRPFSFSIGILENRELECWRFSESVQPVTQAHDGMFPHHFWPDLTHYDLDLFAARALVTVNRALGAGWLFLAKAATFQPHVGVIQQVLAVCTERCTRSMMAPAINLDHRLHRLPFPGHAFAHKRGRRGFACDRG